MLLKIIILNANYCSLIIALTHFSATEQSSTPLEISLKIQIVAQKSTLYSSLQMLHKPFLQKLFLVGVLIAHETVDCCIRSFRALAMTKYWFVRRPLC